MDKYLLEILKNVNTIIIPGLGALTITNHETGEIMFMSYLKHDDGKLANYIVENEGMDELDAKNLIAKYVREIQLTVDKGETYDMFQFGSFFKNEGEIDFKNWEGTKVATKEDVTEEKTIITPPVLEEAPIIKEVEKTVDEVLPPIVEEVVEEKPTIEKKIEPIVLHLTEDEPKKDLNILEKEERAATAAKLEVLRKNQESKNVRSKRGVGFWMLLTLLVLITCGGTYFGMNYDRLKQHVPFLADKELAYEKPLEDLSSTNDIVKEENIDNVNNEAIEEETVLPEESEEAIESEVKTTITKSPSSGNDLPFHIIAGAFGSEENANRFGEKLKSEGFSVKVGHGRGMNLVSIKSFGTREEAEKGLSELKSTAPNGWVYEWK